MTRRWLFPTLFLATTMIPTTSKAVQSAELYYATAYFYGRFEARIQYAPGDGAVSSFFLYRETSTASSWNELDYEKLNADCHMQTNAWTGASVQHTQVNAMPGDICTGYHTYAFEWTPTYISWAVDGCEIRRETGAIPADYVANASGGMRIHFNTWEGNASFGGALNSSILPVHEYISWVQYSSYVASSGTFQLQWREEFTGTGVPSGWGVGNWASPLGLSTHNPANVSFINGIAVLSMTADGATGYTGTPPADPGGPATCGAGTGGTSGTGGTPATGGTPSTGGTRSTGGATATGGTKSTGGMPATGGTKSTGGATATGGTTSTGGATATGGIVGVGGIASTGGTRATGGVVGTGGTTLSGTGGVVGTGGIKATGGIASTGGTTTGVGGTLATTGGALALGGASSFGGNIGTGGSVSTAGTTNTATSASGGGSTGDVGSCSCRVAGQPSRSTPMLGLALLGLLLTRTLRRRRAHF